MPKPAATRQRGSRVQLVHPVAILRRIAAVGLEQQAVGQRVPAAVQRRRDQRVRVVADRLVQVGGVAVGVLGRLLGVVLGEVDERRQLPLEGMRVRLIPLFVLPRLGLLGVGQRLVGHLKRAAKPQHAVQLRAGDSGDVRARPLHVHVAPAESAVRRPRLEHADEVLEIADRASLEVPAEVMGVEQRVRPVLVLGPGGQRREEGGVFRRGGQPEAGAAAALERRHQERVIAGVGIQLARADDARIGLVRVGGEQPLQT